MRVFSIRQAAEAIDIRPAAFRHWIGVGAVRPTRKGEIELIDVLAIGAGVAAISANVPIDVACMLVNRVRHLGLERLEQHFAAGHRHLVIVGMSLVPTPYALAELAEFDIPSVNRAGIPTAIIDVGLLYERLMRIATRRTKLTAEKPAVATTAEPAAQQ